VTNAFPLPNATVLVVDDEPLARRIATRILSEEGYRVWEADGRDEALQVLGEARGRVGLVLLDVVMPRCDGVETGRDILAEWPDQRILYMLAHPAQVLAQHGLKDLDVPFLAKPYTRVELVRKVEDALRRRATSAAVERRRHPRGQE
jgi:two-component system cell cycle sensor histidine kinase/response regulator CckA